MAAALTPDAYVSYSGVARARGSNQFLYGEHHVLRYQAGRLAERVVLYTCRDGAPFARKTVSYVDPIAPDFTLRRMPKTDYARELKAMPVRVPCSSVPARRPAKDRTVAALQRAGRRCRLR